MGHELARDLDGRAHDVEDPIGAREHLHLAGGVVDENDELVAAKTCGEVVASYARADAIGDGREQPVAVRVAEKVVHHLEPVEVEHEHRRGAMRGKAVLELAKQ